MKHINKPFLVIALGFAVLFSCGKANKSEAMDEAYALMSVPAEDEKNSADQALAAIYEVDSKEKSEEPTFVNSVKFVPPTLTVPNFIATSSASTLNDDGVHKLVRTARLKFRVKDVPKATQIIEDVVLKNKGIILKSAINNNNVQSQWINISKDSAYVVYRNHLQATLDLRVSFSLLDSTLRQIAPLAVVIDYRIVEGDDVTAQLMADELKKIRLEKKQRRVSNAISTRSGKLEDAIAAEESLDYAMEEADRTKISEYNMNDKIAYSLIQIEIYQEPVITKEQVLRNDLIIASYEPGYGSKIVDAMSGGWSALASIFLLIIRLWPFWIILAIVTYIFIRIRRKRKGNS